MLCAVVEFAVVMRRVVEVTGVLIIRLICLLGKASKRSRQDAVKLDEKIERLAKRIKTDQGNIPATKQEISVLKRQVASKKVSRD